VGRGRDNSGRAVNEEPFAKIQKSDDVIIVDDSIEDGILLSVETDVEFKEKVDVAKKTDANANLKADAMIVSELTEEEMMNQALEASKAEYQKNEPTAEANFQVLNQNYPDLDQAALRQLCEDYDGRSADLERFVQLRLHELPTKRDAEKTKLEGEIDELKAAGIEGAEKMTVEECPKCKVPKIIVDTSDKVFTCTSPACKGEFCRKCKHEQHIPFKCKGQLFDENVEYQVIKILPKRMFDDGDPLDKEFRIAEGQFLRMNSKAKQNYEIASIDVVHNKALSKKFEDKKEELASQGHGDCLLLFHGTPMKNIEPILKNNFDLSIRTNGRSYGDGVYFSECPEVSLGYSQDLKTLILCKVLLGNNCKEVKRGDSRCWAIVVPNVDQILPRYVINFTGGKK